MVLHGITPEEDSITNGRPMVNGSLLNLDVYKRQVGSGDGDGCLSALVQEERD